MLEIKPSDELSHKNLGSVLLQKGRLDEALFHFQEAPNIRPDDGDARRSFEAVRALQNRIHTETPLHEAEAPLLESRSPATTSIRP